MYLIAGNWKMNGFADSIAELDLLLAAGALPGVELLLCPPATLIAAFAARARGGHVAIGAQDCHTAASGAHTGDLAAEMLRDAGADYLLVGHSERRADHGETDGIVRAKALAAHRAGCTPIVCVGETLAERQAGDTLAVIRRQVRGSVPDGVPGLVVAYEPVWAIGSGLVPTAEQVAEVHDEIAALLPKGSRILYGGSVKPDNAATLLAVPNVSGALVGGASLTAASFLAIAKAVQA